MQQKIIVTGGSGFIGTNVIDLLAQNSIVINVDIVHPRKKAHDGYWRNCNILDYLELKKIFHDFQPTHVIHLAAKATTNGKSLSDYLDNTIGTQNVLTIVKETSSIKRIIVTSTQHVRKPGSGLPKNDIDYVPHGFYGESKVITEQLTRRAGLSCVWTIIRPTTVWGPWHPSLPKGLWHLMRKGLYFHPKNDPVIRSYGYVKNVAWQIDKILNAPSSLVTGKTYYIGDKSIKQSFWINSFSKSLVGRNVIEVPREWIYFLAKVGDFFGLFKINFPMSSPRYFNLTTTNPVPIEPIIELFGYPPYSLDMGIQETTQWLEEKCCTS